jgi:hypothetical protein
MTALIVARKADTGSRLLGGLQKGAYADVVVKLGLVKILTRRFDICDELYVIASRSPLSIDRLPLVFRLLLVDVSF